MDTIELRGLTYYGYHGAFAEEQRLGQRFVVSLTLGLDLQPAGQHDDLDQTVDYGKVAETVRGIVEGPPFRLIEALAEALASAILGGFSRVDRVTVRVEKPSAPVPAAAAGTIAVQIVRTRGDRHTAQISETAASVGTVEATATAGSVIAAAGIRAQLDADPPLVAPLADRDAQVQPNGIDLTLESVWRIDGTGSIGVTNADRTVPDRIPVEATADGWFVLGPGTYVIRLQEVVALPLDVMAFGRSRSSLLRCGASLHTAVWDAGYVGRSESLLVVYAADGIRLAAGARVLQLVFVRLEAPTHAYAGTYQGENLPPT